MEKTQHPKDKENQIDSPINTQDANSKNGESLTNDESANADPNEAEDKASFSDNDQRKPREAGRFDGKIEI